MNFFKKYGDIVIVLSVVLVFVITIPMVIVGNSHVDYGIADQVESVRNSVVHIRKPGAWEGSGCIISDDGIIFTARHVLTGGGKYIITLDNGEEYESTALVIDKKHDVGFIKINPNKPLHVVKLADMDSLRVGSGVFIMGSPYGDMNFNSVSLGIMSAKKRSIDRKGWGWEVLFQSDATACPGNSGGPVFNMDGNVIGVLVGGMPDSLNYSVPVAVFKDSVDIVRSWFELSRFEVLSNDGILSEDDVYEYYDNFEKTDRELRCPKNKKKP